MNLRVFVCSWLYTILLVIVNSWYVYAYVYVYVYDSQPMYALLLLFNKFMIIVKRK